MKIALLVLPWPAGLFPATPAWAHGGHGQFAEATFMHYLAEPIHSLFLLAVAASALASWRLFAARRDWRTRSRSEHRPPACYRQGR